MRLYILCRSELSRRKLSPTLATPTTVVLTTLVAQCELSRRKIGLLLEVIGRKFSHRPGNPATVGVVRWPAAGDTAGSSLCRLSSLQHRIYNLLGHAAYRRAETVTRLQTPPPITAPATSHTPSRPSKQIPLARHSRAELGTGLEHGVVLQPIRGRRQYL